MQTKSNDIILFVIVTTLIILFLISFITAVLFLYQKKNIVYFKELEDVKNSYEKYLLQTQLEIQEQTFLNISREIHDNIGLSLTLAKLQLNTIDYSNQLETSENIGSSVDLISKAICDLSDISKSLNSEAIKTHGLYNTLKVETEKICRSGKYTIDFMVKGNAIFLDAQKELVLYRIAQEALNNVLKHASATQIWLSLKYEVNQIIMSIRDNGNGFEKSVIEKQIPGKITAGLTNMCIRANSINGFCNIESNTGYGTTIIVTVPY
jgi:two-component system, NarL family, sensor kinase